MSGLRPEIADVLEGRSRFVVVHGDNAEILPTLGMESVDAIIQDPPYSEHVHGKQRRILSGAGKKSGSDDGLGHKVKAAALGFDAITAEQVRFISGECARLSRRWVLTFSDAEGNSDWRREMTAAGLDHIRVGAWIKVNGQPQLTGDRPAVGFEAIEIAHPKGRKRWNWGGLPAVWAHAIATDRNGTGERVHTTQKPVSLILDLIAAFTDENDVILDPFAGSSTTGVAALRMGRRFIGIEKSAEYAAVSRLRLQAEASGQSLGSYRAGQHTLFGSTP